MAGQYQFIQELGEGAQGKVFLANRLSDGKKVAIKQLRIDSIKTWKEYTLFHREADVLAKLDIPGVVKLCEARDDLDAEPPCSYIVQEYVEGMTLKQMLKSGYRFPLDRVYDIVLQLLDILEKLHAHEPPIIHRDIKPSNIIIKQNDDSDDFQVYLIDFGAVANPQIQSGGSTIAGTFGYMAPEQNIGRPAPQSDTYALAALTAYLISGVDPAEMKTQDLRLIIDPYVENHPVALVQTLRRMLEPNLNSRLADIPELRKRFNDFKNGHYILENEAHALYSKDDLLKRLKAVHSLCQPQNLELWQNLPDLPENRPAYPCELTTHPRFINYPHEKTESESNPHNYFLTIMILTFVLSFVIMVILSILKINIDVSKINIYTFLLLMSPLILSIEITFIAYAKRPLMTLILIKIIQAIKKLFSANRTLSIINSESAHPIVPCPKHLNIFKNGRKTIATVTCIEYIGAELAYAYADRKYYRIETPSKFAIYYKFNPPDDDTEFDIIHRIIVHQDPTGRIKEGDPLPILYIGDGKHPEHITQSMPYPFPMADLDLPDDYIGKAVADDNNQLNYKFTQATSI